MTQSHIIMSDGCRLEYEVEGDGRPVLWQHGLGAPFAQPAAVFPKNCGLMRVTLACRGHESSDLGDPAKLSIPTFADDCLALLDHLGIEKAAAGGISLGAGIALRLAALHPRRVSQLVVARPAWVDRPSLETQSIYLEVAKAIESHGLDGGLTRLQALPAFQALRAASPDNAKSALSCFSRPRPETTIALLSSIAVGFPGLSALEISSIKIPALVIANGEDIVHPLRYAEALSRLLPSARLQIITSKTMAPLAYENEFKSALFDFLARGSA